MDDTLAPCRNCGDEILAGSYECPNCGHSTEKHNRRRLYLGAAGTVLTLTLVLAPIGIPLLWLAHRHRRLAELTVTEQPRTGMIPHLGRVIRRHMDLDFTFEREADFVRGSSDGDRELRGPPKL